MRRLPIFSIVTAALLVVLLLLYSITFEVRFSERVVRVHFGKAQDVEDKPGLHLKWPAPIETVKAYDMRLRVLDTTETEVKTQDGQNLIVGCSAIWRIEDPKLFHIRVLGERDAEDKLRTRINSARNIVLGRHAMSDLVNLDSELVARTHDAIYREILDVAAPGVRADYGVQLVQVNIRRISVPDEATGAIQMAMAAERNALATNFQQEGASMAETIKSRARSEADKIKEFAKLRATEIESAGVRASERILAQIKGEDSEFFIWLRYLEALQVALKTKTTIFLDSDADLFKPFATPLGETPMLPNGVRALPDKPKRPAGKSEDQ